MSDSQVTELAEALRGIYRRLDLLHDEQSQVTPKEIELMAVLEERGTTRVIDLAEQVHLPLSTVSWTVDRMVNRRFLRRKDDPHDRRVILLSLTKKGRGVLANHNRLFLRLAWSALATLSEAEKTTITNAIKKMTDSL